MQDAEKPDLRAQMLGIMRNGLEGLGHGLKQQGIDHTGILQRKGTELGGEGKDDMAVGHLQDLALPCRQPGGLGWSLALGAVPIPTGIIADLLMATMIAPGFVAPEDCCAALCDGLEYPALSRRGHRTIAGQVGIPILAGHIGDFPQRAGHGRRSRGASSGKVSRGLGVAWSACGLTWR
jgi:hypothetical protein